MSGLKRRLSTCLRPTQLCGGRPTKRKSFNFLLLVYSQLCGVDRRRKIIQFSTSGPLPFLQKTLLFLGGFSKKVGKVHKKRSTT
ncbi:hypothetical protein [Globicatella sanguinis]